MSTQKPYTILPGKAHALKIWITCSTKHCNYRISGKWGKCRFAGFPRNSVSPAQCRVFSQDLELDEGMLMVNNRHPIKRCAPCLANTKGKGKKQLTTVTEEARIDPRFQELVGRLDQDDEQG